MDKPLKVVLVDDDIQLMESLGQKVSMLFNDLEVVSCCTNIIDAYQQITLHHPQIVFLDIHLGSTEGFELLDLFDHIFFETIILTGDDTFGIKAVKYKALDYILKPIKSSELIKAVEKAKERIKIDNIPPKLDAQPQRISISTGSKIEFVPIDQIIHVEADGNYSWIHMSEGRKICTSITIQDIEGKLASNIFFRVHRSYIVNLRRVKSFTNKKEQSLLELDNGRVLPVSKARKKDLLRVLSV